MLENISKHSHCTRKMPMKKKEREMENSSGELKALEIIFISLKPR